MELKSKLLSLISRTCAALLALLGFSCSSSSGDDPDIPLMYGCPTGSFEVKGAVTNEEGAPIPDAVIKVTEPDTDSGLWSITRGVTNDEGRYLIRDSHVPFDSLKIVCIPVGNVYMPDSITVSTTYLYDEEHKKDSWYIGHADLTVDFKLKKISGE